MLPWVLVRLAHFKGIDGKFRLFRYGHWIPAQWREFHELYEFARMRGWQREQLVYGAGTFSRPGVYLELEYLKTLLLMRLDSGNFTPDQVEWVAKQLEDWAPSLSLVPPPGADATFRVDLTGTQGLRRVDRQHDRRPRPLSRREPGLLAHRRADALAARAGRNRRSPAISPRASSGCC